MVYAYKVPSHKKRNFFENLSVNNTLVLINVVCFFLFWIFFLFGLSSDYIALVPFNIIHGMFLWTFLTSMFMHGGFFHLFANMLSLFFVGSLVEKILGPKRYFYFYLISGLFAGLFFVLIEILFSGNLQVGAVGASGALFGLVGFLMLITPNLPVYVMFIPIPIKMKYAAPGILLLLWAISLGAGLPIGNTAHLGGLIVGLIYGFYLKGKYKNKTRYIRRYFS